MAEPTQQFVKRFFIDFGLRPGYEQNANSYTIDDVQDWYLNWQKDRASKDRPYFSGMVTATNFVYAYKSDNGTKGAFEPAARIEGEISKDYHENIFDDDSEILNIIVDLADNMQVKAQQERVHIIFGDKSFVLEK